MQAIGRASIFATLVTLLSGVSGHAAVFTLEDALATTYETNLMLAAERAQLRSTDEDVARARSAMRPQINATGYIGRSLTQKQTSDTYSTPLNGAVTITEQIFRGGRSAAEVARAKSLVLAERGRLISTEQTVLLQAVTAYMDVVRDTARLRITEQTVGVLSQTNKSVRTMFAAGAVTKTDLQQSDARLAQARLSVYAARASLDASRANYERVVGRPAETLETAPKTPAMPANLDAALQDAKAQHPEIIIANNEERAAEHNVKDAIGALLPQLSVVGEYQYRRDYQSFGNYQVQKPQNELTILGQVTVPIYQGGGEEASVRQAKEQHAKAKLAAADAQRRVEELVRSSWSAYLAAQDSIAASEAQAAADEQAVKGVTLEQQGGERSVLDVLNAEQEYLSAQITAVNAVHDRMIAAYRVLAATGELTANALHLKTQLYDPKEHYQDNAGKWFGLGE